MPRAFTRAHGVFRISLEVATFVRKSLPWALALVPILASGVLYLEFVWMVGFPNGMGTELERARKVLFTVVIGLNFTWSLWFVRLGRRARTRTVTRGLAQNVLALAVYCVVVAVLDHVLALHLDNGVGG